MATDENSFRELDAEEFPQGASPALTRQLNALHRIAKQVRTISNGHFLFIELARRADFARTINETPAAYGTRVIVATLLRDMVVGLASLFDQDENATDLRRVVNELLKEENRKTLESFHSTFPGQFATGEHRARLKRLRSKINREPYKGALQRIVDLRRKAVAHMDLEPGFPRGRPIIRDLGLILTCAGVVAREASLFAFGRHYDLYGAKEISQEGAQAFAQILRFGVEQWRNTTAK